MNKKEILDYCHSLLQQKGEVILFALNEISESMQNETKSSLGDKHETSRAKMHAEQEKLGMQLKELDAQIEVVNKIEPHLHHQQITLGSFIKTNTANFFIATALGKIEINNKTVFVISSASPFGKLLMGKQKDATFDFNKSEIRIISVD